MAKAWDKMNADEKAEWLNAELKRVNSRLDAKLQQLSSLYDSNRRADRALLHPRLLHHTVNLKTELLQLAAGHGGGNP